MRRIHPPQGSPPAVTPVEYQAPAPSPPPKKSSGLSCLPVLTVLFLAFACWILFTRIPGVQATTPPPTVTPIPTTTATPIMDDWSHPVTPAQLPPSHEGGSAPVAVTPPTGGIAARLALTSRGFPDASVSASVPTGAKKVAAIFSYYWPNLGGTNCANFRSDIPSWAADYPEANKSNGWCWSTFSNGERWENWMNRAVACPQSWAFGTKVYAFGKECICKDHGGAIVDTGGGAWIDFMTPNPPIAFRSHFDVWIVKP